ncbi:MAG: site-2 protease family protein [Cyclobacteriaceae bacterium]
MNKEQKTKLIQLGLFIATLITTTLAGTEWMFSKYLILGITWSDFVAGFAFSVPFLGILTVHEFGHYFTARYHQIKVSLPYYIPLWFGFMLSPSLGTMGAFIRIREHIDSRLKYFDVGVSGPIAGFVVALGVLYYGFSNLPPQEYIYEIHPEYEQFQSVDEAINASEGIVIHLGGNLLFDFFKTHVADQDLLPHENELMHYPWLLAGYLALFFTALNLLPIGQLDGGHVLFGLFGPRKHGIISRVLFTGFVFYAGLGWVGIDDLQDKSWESLGDFLLSIGMYLVVVYFAAYGVFKEKKDRLLYATVLLTVQFLLNAFTGWEGYQGWLLFSVLIGRFLGVDHPPVTEDQELSMGRKIIGWIALVIFIICFSPEPLVLEIPVIQQTP